MLAIWGSGTAVAEAADCTASPVAKTVAYKHVAGVPEDLTSLDLYAPSRACRRGRKTPVVMWVHGGGYSVGDKSNIGIPRTITVVRGTARRQAIEQHFVTALRGAGIRATVIDARELSHAEVSARIGAPGDTTMTPPIVGFLKGCFG